MKFSETVSRETRAILLGEEFNETSRIMSEYYSCLMENCNPIEQAVIHHLKEVIENYEKCITEILVNGLTIQECMDAYMKRGEC